MVSCCRVRLTCEPGRRWHVAGRRSQVAARASNVPRMRLSWAHREPVPACLSRADRTEARWHADNDTLTRWANGTVKTAHCRCGMRCDRRWLQAPINPTRLDCRICNRCTRRGDAIAPRNSPPEIPARHMTILCLIYGICGSGVMGGGAIDRVGARRHSGRVQN